MTPTEMSQAGRDHASSGPPTRRGQCTHAITLMSPSEVKLQDHIGDAGGEVQWMRLVLLRSHSSHMNRRVCADEVQLLT